MKVQYVMDVYPWTSLAVPPILLNVTSALSKPEHATRYLVSVEFPDPAPKHDGKIEAKVDILIEDPKK